MKPWHWKLVKDTAKSLLPFKRQLRALKRRASPYTSNPANDRMLLQQGLEQLALFKSHAIDLRGKSVLEIGTGWVPITALLYRLAGAKQVVLSDQEQLLDQRLFEGGARYIVEHADEVGGVIGLSKGQIEDALQIGSTELQTTLRSFGFRYMVPLELEKLESGSIDVIVSRAVLEHIPEQVLHAIFDAARRVLAAGGLMCHTVDNSDHWQHFDKSISRLNFLTIEDRWWRWTHLNVQNFQNRMRHSDYVAAFERFGYAIVDSKRDVHAETLAQVPALPLIKRYAAYAPEDLATLTSMFLVAKGN